MRAGWGFGAAAIVVAAAAAGCDSSGSLVGVDSGADAAAGDATGGGADADAGVFEAAPFEACVPEASVDAFPAPDASIGDAGATAPGCIACVGAACPAFVSECNASCACIAAFAAFEQCLAAGSDPVACATTMATQAELPIVDVVQCVQACSLACNAPPLPEGGPDAVADANAADAAVEAGMVDAGDAGAGDAGAADATGVDGAGGE